jgi:integrase/recombinase XerD
MKVRGNGQAKILSESEKELLFARGFQTDRDRALFGICLYTGCRISEALALERGDINLAGDLPRGRIAVFRRATTKGKAGTRSVPVHDELHELLQRYLQRERPQRWEGFLFASGSNGRHDKPLSRAAADLILRKACDRVGLIGISTHSFRRTALTRMANAGVPLPVIRRISGHASLGTLQRYLDVTSAQLECAIESI